MNRMVSRDPPPALLNGGHFLTAESAVVRRLRSVSFNDLLVFAADSLDIRLIA
jgi:hypothetical protein